MDKTRRFHALANVFLIASSVLAATAQAENRPNIVMAFADDWGYHAGIYGRLDPGTVNDHAVTPHFDALASEGVLFRHAFVSAPSCTPCRSSLLSGQHFWRCGLGAILQGAIWDDAIPSYPLLLEGSGYRIGHTYKVWSPGTPANAPHGGARTSFNSKGNKFNGFSQRLSQANDVSAMKETLLNEVRGNFLSFLDPDGDGKANANQPFCYWFGPTNVHRKWIAGSGKKYWNINPDDLKGKLPPYFPDAPTIREDFADYFGEIAAFDAGLGVLLDILDEQGLAENTVVVVSGDHGFPGVTRGKCNLYDFGTRVPLAIRWPSGIKHAGRVVDDFVSLPDLATTFLDVASVPIPSTMTATSLTPLLVSDKSGQIDPKRDAVFTGRERHVAEVRAGNKPYPQRAIRTNDYLLIRNFEPNRWPMGEGPGYGRPQAAFASFDVLANNTFTAFGDLDASPTKAWIIEQRESEPKAFDFAFGRRPEWELYAVGSDPDCLTNLAKDTDHQAAFNELKDRLMATLSKTGDPRVSDNVVFERSPYTDARKPKKRK